MGQWLQIFRRTFSKTIQSAAGALASCWKGQSRERLDVYRNCEKLPLPCKQLGFLTDGGRIFEQGDIEALFVKRAKAMGGDALVMLPPVKSIESPPGWSLYDTFLYEAVVVAYD